jgi:hypothetical protein
MRFTKYANINVRAIWKVTCGELLTKRAMRRFYYMQKIHTYLNDCPA